MFVSRLALIAVSLTVPCVATPINVALAGNGSLVVQSSTAWGGLASLATDGNTDGDFGHGSVSGTADEMNPWWKVTFSGSYLLSSINIYNRTDGSDDTTHPLSVFLYDASGDEVWSSLNNALLGPSYLATFSNLQVQASSMTVQSNGFGYLQLAEVQAWTGESGPPPPTGGEVPEPATCALIGGGLAGLGLLHRHKQRFLPN